MGIIRCQHTGFHDIEEDMGIAYIVLAFGILLLLLLFGFWSRIGAQPVNADEPSEPMPEAAAAGGAGNAADSMATIQFHSSALGQREPRKGGVDIRDKQPRLIGVTREVRGISFPLEPTGAIIGRAPDNRIQVADPRVSQRHVWVGIVHDKAIVCDLNSTNGTFLNVASDTPITEAELRPDDTVLLGGHGGTQFRFVVD